MNILAIETSCDETGIAILRVKGGKNANFSVLSNIISSQVKIHAKYGGVYPLLAKREHQKNLPLVFKKALKKAKLLLKEIDLIAVTNGPGLEPCLWTGINFAKDLAEKIEKPIVLVNHIEAHILVNWLLPINEISKQIPNSKFKISKIKFPAICLVVSGGHTQLILMNRIGKYKIIGETRDDAAGECFDKTARILGLGYPGGPAIAKHACKGQSFVKLPRPMMYQKNYDFSFSGLKTAVLYDFKNQTMKTKKSKQYIQEMSAEIQQAIIDVLIHKTLKTVKDYKAKTIILAGGVASNKELVKQFKIKRDILCPLKNLCTDNALMIAISGYFNQDKKIFKLKNWKKIKANANLRI